MNLLSNPTPQTVSETKQLADRLLHHCWLTGCRKLPSRADDPFDTSIALGTTPTRSKTPCTFAQISRSHLREKNVSKDFYRVSSPRLEKSNAAAPRKITRFRRRGITKDHSIWKCDAQMLFPKAKVDSREAAKLMLGALWLRLPRTWLGGIPDGIPGLKTLIIAMSRHDNLLGGRCHDETARRYGSLPHCRCSVKLCKRTRRD